MQPNEKRLIAAISERRAVRKDTNHVEIFDSAEDAERYIQNAKQFGFTESYVINDGYSPKRNHN